MALEPDASPGFLLWRATLRWQREVAAALVPLDLTHVQFVLLASAWWLDSAGVSPNQRTLAEHAGTDIKMTSQVLRALEDKGLVTRVVDPSDTRARTVRPTPSGSSRAKVAIERVEDADARFFAVLPAADRERVIPILVALDGGSLA
jgi:DNA-binding MarR family transcriptional regulator